jgi:uncharacterized phage protein (TIGR02218 family)
MPRTIPSALLTLMKSDAWHPAILVKVTTESGDIEGFTSASFDIVHSGVTYVADSGIGMSSIVSTIGAGVDNTQSTGATIDGQIEAALVMRGKYDKASWVAYLCDFTSLASGVYPISAGVVGDIEITDNKFRLDQFGLGWYLKRVKATSTQKLCRCFRPGDVQCKANMAGTISGISIRQTRLVSTVTSQKKMRFASTPAFSSFFTYGFVKFTTGLNAGIERQVKTHALVSGQAEVEVILPFPYAISIGDEAVLEAGCNGRLKYDSADPLIEPRIASTCSEFGNGANFHGEHFLPGNDTVARTVNR